MRREYPFSLTVNGIKIDKVIIDPHYEKKHLASLSDKLILILVRTLKDEHYRPVDERSTFKYFVKNEIKVYEKRYRLVWLLEENQNYIGVVNAFRSS